MSASRVVAFLPAGALAGRPAHGGSPASSVDGQPLRFRVEGPPQGKGRPRAFAIRSGARAGQVALHTPAKTRTYEGLIRSAALEALERRGHRLGAHPAPLRPPLLLCVDAHYPVPAGWPAWKRAAALAGAIRPTVKPDLDNVVKAVKDALNGAVWVDDARVCAVRQRKVYSDAPRLEIAVELLPCQSAQDARRGEP